MEYLLPIIDQPRATRKQITQVYVWSVPLRPSQALFDRAIDHTRDEPISEGQNSVDNLALA